MLMAWRNLLNKINEARKWEGNVLWLQQFVVILRSIFESKIKNLSFGCLIYAFGGLPKIRKNKRK